MIFTVLVFFFFGVNCASADNWTKLDMPGATNTIAWGIDGTNIVGTYADATGNHGFLYNGTTWINLDMPGATNTCPRGISGNNIVGNYADATGIHGFLYNGTTWINLDMPGASDTRLYGIDGSNIVGNYADAKRRWHGFLYNGKIWTTLDMPGVFTCPYDIDGSNIVGIYLYNGWQNFLYDGKNWTTLYPPGTYSYSVGAFGIDGNNIVGEYLNTNGLHGFLYNGTTWINLDMPGARYTDPRGISGNKIVGYYYEDEDDFVFISHTPHGFIYTIPAPLPASKINVSGGIVTVSFPSSLGSSYSIESSTDLVHWSSVTNVTADSNGKGTFSELMSGQAKYYRVLNQTQLK